MPVGTIEQFVNLVKEMRAEQRKLFFKYKYLTEGSENEKRVKLEAEVDKAIRERDKRIKEQLESQQGSLFG